MHINMRQIFQENIFQIWVSTALKKCEYIVFNSL